MDKLFQKIIVDGWKFIQDKPDIVQAITSIFPIIGAAGAAILAFLKWGLPQISRLWKRRALQKKLTDLFPFEVIKPPERESDVQKLEVLRCLLGSLEPVDYPLADFNIPYKHRDPKINVLHELERCFNQSNWVLILGRSGLGKTREAAEFALQLHSQGWTILRMTMEGKWLDIPLRFPSDRVPHQRLLFFLDNLNQPMYASRVREGRTQDGLSDDLLRQPLQERLLEYLKFFELECGAEQVRVIATVRNERMPRELGESTSLDMLELEKYKNFWNRFTRYELPDLAPAVIVKMLQGAVEREIVKAQPEDFNEMARCNDGTFRNLVINLREARTGKKLLTRQNYQETLTGSWEDMFRKVMKRYSFALAVYNAIDLLRKLDIDLNVIEDVTIQKWLLCETSKLFVKGRWKRWKVTWTVPRVIKIVPQLLNPPDGMIEAKKVHLEAIDYLQSISQLLLKQAKKRPEELIQALYGFSFSAFFLERDREAANGFRELLRLLEVLETQIQALDTQTQDLVPRLALQDFQSQILMALGTAEAGIGQEAKKIHQIDLAELQFKAAISSYNKALDLKPDDYVAWNEHGAIWGDLNNYEAAIKSYNKALELKPDYDVALYNRGNALEKLGCYSDAIASYDDALRIKPDKHPAWFNRGNMLIHLGRNEEALSSFDKALQIKPDKYEAWNNRGVVLGTLGENEQAIISFDKALKYKPDYHEAWFGRGFALDNIGCHIDAIASYDKAIECKPDFYGAWGGRGHALSLLGHQDGAIRSFQKALEYNPNFFDGWNNLGISLYLTDRLEEAITCFEKVIQARPDDVIAWFNLGNIVKDLGFLQKAIVCYGKVLEVNPHDHESLNKLGQIFIQLNYAEVAIECFKKALEHNSNNSSILNNQGVALGMLGRYEESITSLDEALKLESENYEAWSNRGFALASLEHYEEAITNFDKALQINPNCDHAWYLRGDTLYHLGRHKEAISNFNKTLALRPDDPNISYGKARCYALQNNLENAIANLSRAIALSSDKYREMAKTDSDFDSVRDNELFQALIAV